ncbi:EVI5 [Mytilus coruscus]|uniref:EVI5 n=1 Tax=Mytilus coruscus TaxID=42192 RepID=A0A6J8ETN1_MYTCO|nr:EVI5 [Mytilus coruscus]
MDHNDLMVDRTYTELTPCSLQLAQKLSSCREYCDDLKEFLSSKSSGRNNSYLNVNVGSSTPVEIPDLCMRETKTESSIIEMKLTHEKTTKETKDKLAKLETENRSMNSKINKQNERHSSGGEYCDDLKEFLSSKYSGRNNSYLNVNVGSSTPVEIPDLCMRETKTESSIIEMKLTHEKTTKETTDKLAKLETENRLIKKRINTVERNAKTNETNIQKSYVKIVSKIHSDEFLRSNRGGLDKRTSSENAMCTFLDSRNVRVTFLRYFDKHYRESAFTHLKVAAEDDALIKNPEFWPKGIFVKLWLSLEQFASDSNNHGYD